MISTGPGNQQTCDPEIVIIGAGISGLLAADTLRQAGYDRIRILEKGRGVGGRMASRRMGSARCDHGAQFLTARAPRFVQQVETCIEQGALVEWYRTFPGATGEYPRYRGHPGMTGPAKTIARNLDIQLSSRVTAIRQRNRQWHLDIDGQPPVVADAVLLTPPVPQTLDLLKAGSVKLAKNIRQQLEDIQYHKCLAVMAILAGPSRIPAPGALASPVAGVDWISDNQQKGISDLPAVTVHANPEFSDKYWDQDRQAAGAELLRLVGDLLGQSILETQIHGWRYSKPIRIHPERCMVVCESPPLILAGDAFGGPRVEGAALSGWAAAEQLTSLFVYRL